MVNATSSLAEQFENIDTGKYMINLINHYSSVNSSANADLIAETYSDTTKDTSTTNIASDFDNPFARIVNVYQL